MNGILITWPQLALISCLLLVVYLAGFFFLLKKHKPAAGNQHDSLEAEHELIRDELVALRRELAGLRSRLDEDNIQAPPAESDSAYSQAMKLAEKGLDSAAVAASCGISRGEAELIVALYRASQRP